MSTHRSPPEPLEKPNEHPTAWLLRRIWDRVNRDNEHFMGVVVGREGSGKSHTALRIAKELDPTFTADRVIFEIGELLRVLREGDHSPGNFYVLDEAGVQLGNRTWHDRGQILANQALQLIRNHNLGLLFTLPRLGELDSQTQGRLQAFLELTEKQPGEYVRGKWKWIDPDRTDQTGKEYKKYPKRRRNGRVERLTTVSFTPPDSELVEPYEREKRAFQDRVYEETIAALDGDEGDDKSDAQTPQEIADEILNGRLAEVVDEHGNTGEPYINKDLIRATFGTSHSDARVIKTFVEREIDDLATAGE